MSAAGKTKKGFLERLNAGELVIGDGGFVFSLEKRGFVKAGPWTPECCIENPEAVIQLHREFGRAGSDVFQTFTFYASDDKLENRGNKAQSQHSGVKINEAACRLAHQVADEFQGLVAGGLSQTPTYLSNVGEEATKAHFRKQCKVFQEQKVDFMICEYFEHVEEAVWAVEVCREFGFDTVASLCCNSEGDLHDISIGQCGIRLVKAGACCVGVNCHFDPFISVDAVADMKKAVEAAGLKAHYVCQPLAYFTPDANKQGFIALKEFPFALEPRVCSRWDMQKYARKAYEAGIQFIGGCCGFEPYHIRAVSEELQQERGFLPKASDKHEPNGSSLKMHTKPWVRVRSNRDYWYNLEPASGRPKAAAFCDLEDWKVTQGSSMLQQKTDETTKEELEELKVYQKNL